MKYMECKIVLIHDFILRVVVRCVFKRKRKTRITTVPFLFVCKRKFLRQTKAENYIFTAPMKSDKYSKPRFFGGCEIGSSLTDRRGEFFSYHTVIRKTMWLIVKLLQCFSIFLSQNCVWKCRVWRGPYCSIYLRTELLCFTNLVNTVCFRDVAKLNLPMVVQFWAQANFWYCPSCLEK